MEKKERSYHTITNLQTAMDTYRERNKCYGDNYKHFGRVMTALYPDGLTLADKSDWNRLGVFIQIMSKLTRYVADPHKGHHDSIHDAGVYCMMLEELDAAIAGLDTYHPIPAGSVPPQDHNVKSIDVIAPRLQCLTCREDLIIENVTQSLVCGNNNCDKRMHPVGYVRTPSFYPSEPSAENSER
jgi:hypothetical protein